MGNENIPGLEKPRFLGFLVFYRAMLAQSAVMRLHIVRPSVRLSMTLRYDFHTGWNSLKIISRPNSLRPLLWVTPNIGDLVQREHPQNCGSIGVG